MTHFPNRFGFRKLWKFKNGKWRFRGWTRKPIQFFSLSEEAVGVLFEITKLEFIDENADTINIGQNAENQ